MATLPCPAGISPEVHALLCNQMDAMADRVAEGDSIAQAARALGINRNRANNVWRTLRTKMGKQAS